MTTIAAYIFTCLLFVGIDLTWLMGPGRSIYVAEIGGLLKTSPNVAAVSFFYLIYAAGVMFFAVSPALSTGTAGQAFLKGLVFGFMAYATYDLTNLAIMNGFTTKIAVIDLIWGTILTGAVSWIVVKTFVMLGWGGSSLG